MKIRKTLMGSTSAIFGKTDGSICGEKHVAANMVVQSRAAAQMMAKMHEDLIAAGAVLISPDEYLMDHEKIKR